MNLIEEGIMPLSKERMRERKKQDRNVKPDCLIVKPVLDAVSPSVTREGCGEVSDIVYPAIDADGNIIPEL